MNDHIIYGVHITDRLEKASTVQAVLTEYGRNIKTRLGLHEVQTANDGANGVLILEMTGDAAKCAEMKAKLGAIAGIEVKEMIFKH
jgi:hypothetical protein